MKLSRLRSFVSLSLISQFTASTVKNILLFEMGVMMSFPTLIIPFLLKGDDWRGVKFTEVDASWFGSMLSIFEPVGSILAGFLFIPFGRKHSMMLANIPYALSWLLLYFASSTSHFYAASALIGLTMGLTETPVVTYVSEISETEIRGTIISFSNLFYNVGLMCMFALGSVIEWRTAALLCLSLPVLSTVTLTLVPETPIWLLSQGREAEAEEALKWLRGWTSSEQVAHEFAKMKNNLAETNTGSGSIRVKTTKVLSDTFRPAVLRPLALLSTFFFISAWTGVSGTLPYLVLLSSEFRFPIDPFQVATLMGLISLIANIFCILSIATFKKRPIALCSFATAFVSCIILATLPIGTSNGWPAFFAYCTLIFANFYGIYGIPWAFASEIFPFRGRALASGMAVACCYIGSFLSAKTYLQLRELLGLRQLFIVYGCVSAFGLIFGYYVLPETEGVSLEEIEQMYSETKKRARYGSGNEIKNIDT